MRKVVTAKDASGKSIFLSDEEVDPVTLAFLPGVEFFILGGGEEAPDVSPGCSEPEHVDFFPSAGGFRCTISTIPPGTVVQTPQLVDKAAALKELNEKLPGLLSASEREPGMHTSRTVDFVYVIEGQITLELDDGAMRELAPGDLVVQMGARHRWGNIGPTTGRMLSVIIGAK